MSDSRDISADHTHTPADIAGVAVKLDVALEAGDEWRVRNEQDSRHMGKLREGKRTTMSRSKYLFSRADTCERGGARFGTDGAVPLFPSFPRPENIVFQKREGVEASPQLLKAAHMNVRNMMPEFTTSKLT